jgi:Pyridoxamine 5'-phosphate oxidase
MRKPAQLRANPAVEAAWWCKAAGVQWRVRGVARIVSAVPSPSDHGPSDAKDDGEGGGEVATAGGSGAAAELAEAVEAVHEQQARSALEARMYDIAGDVAMNARWTWETEVAAWFAGQSPRIRGASLPPPPYGVTLFH